MGISQLLFSSSAQSWISLNTMAWTYLLEEIGDSATFLSQQWAPIHWLRSLLCFTTAIIWGTLLDGVWTTLLKKEADVNKISMVDGLHLTPLQQAQKKGLASIEELLLLKPAEPRTWRLHLEERSRTPRTTSDTTTRLTLSHIGVLRLAMKLSWLSKQVAPTQAQSQADLAAPHVEFFSAKSARSKRSEQMSVL